MNLVFLIGYRGSGKTTVARLLADKLAWDWVDADEALERRHGRTIHQIFADQGEADFRDKEAGVLADLARLERHVVATGGGVVLRPENRAALKAGKVVWLTAPARVLWERLGQDAATARQRPALAQGGLAEVEDLVRARQPLYATCADWTVSAADKSPDQVADLIYQWLEP